MKRRFLRLAALALLWSFLSVGLLRLAPLAQDRPRDPDTDAMIDRARTLPPEFAIDILLRLTASPRISDAMRRELVEDAWNRTYLIREPYRMTALAPPTDTRTAAQIAGFDSRLDRVSLQTRATRAMIPLSPSRAREMFEWIDFELKPLTCQDPLVPLVDDYYETLAVVARSTFGPSALERADALFFFEVYSWKATHPTEMASLARALGVLEPSGEDAQYFESEVGWIFDHGEQTPREFATVGTDLVSKIAEIDEIDRRAGVVGGALLRGLRRYLVTQLTGPRCSDSVTEGRAMAGFNRIADRRSLAVTGLTPIGAGESRPQRMAGPLRYEFLWQTAESRRLRDEAAALADKPDPRRPGRMVRATRDKAWFDRAEQLLVDVEHWVGVREVESDFMWEKGVLLTGLTELLPDGPLRLRALRSAITFLRTIAGHEKPGVWYAHVTRLIDLGRREFREPVLDALEASSEPVMSAYARLERYRAATRRR